MTMGEIEKLEIKLGRRATQQEIFDEKTRQLMEIKAYANYHSHSDVNPYEVLRTISPICVVVRAMHTKQTKFPTDFNAGGFVGHYNDNESGQEYQYSSNKEIEVMRIRWSKAKRQWQSACGRSFYMADKPYKFYDYNF